MLKVTMLEYRTRIGLTQQATGSPNWNLPMNVPDFKVYLGSYNNVEFVVRNTDRKAINLLGKTLTATFVDFRSTETLGTKALSVVDPYRGVALLQLTPEDIAMFSLGYHRYTVTVENPDGTHTLLYTDQAQNVRGYFEVLEGATLGPRDSLIVTQFKTESYGSPVPVTHCHSSALPGSQQVNNLGGLHTAAVYMTDFSGTIFVDGTLELVAPTSNDDWFSIAVHSVENFSGIWNTTFEHNLQWVRFRYLPDSTNAGTLDKILFRN